MLGSATPTPLPVSRLSQKPEQLPQELVEKLKTHPKLASRRIYKEESPKGKDEVVAEIKEAAKQGESLIYMINLIDQGTALIAEDLKIPVEPWLRETRAYKTPVFWLDSTIPQAYRADLIKRIKETNPHENGCILLCTSIIQASIDLDFKSGKFDEDSISSLLQGAGRVGRNGGPTRTATNFQFLIENETSTKKFFQKKKTYGLQSPAGKPLHQAIQAYEQSIENEEDEFFSNWGEKEEKTEQELLQKMKEIQNRHYRKLGKKIKIPETLEPSAKDTTIGLCFQDWHDLSTLYENKEETGTHILLREPPTKKIDKFWIAEYEKTHGTKLGKNILRIIKNSMEPIYQKEETTIWIPVEKIRQI